jgi:energy-coupling factor transporter ATP-binding protein EcfA2
MIQLSGAGKRFGHKLLFENTDWLITPRDRVGLVGANGTGKSTLMKVLAGLDTLDYGSLIVAKGTTAGLSAAGWALAFRPHGVCGMHDGFHRTARHGAGAGNSDPPHLGTRSHQPGICRRRGPLSQPGARIPHARWLLD